MKASELAQLIIQKDQQVSNLRSKAISGNNSLLNLFLDAINSLLLNEKYHPEAYKQITELCISGSPYIINETNNKVLKGVGKRHRKESLEEYIILWKRMFNGTAERIDYPNVKSNLSCIHIQNEERELSQAIKNYYKQFEKNMNLLQDKRIEFFQDFEEDSFATDSAEEELLSDIIEMDISEVKAIRSYLQKEKVDQLTAQEYLIKMKNFLAHKPSTLSKQLSEDFNNQRIWAKHYISSYKDFIKGDSDKEVKASNSSLPSQRSPSGVELKNLQEQEIKVEDQFPHNAFNKKRYLKEKQKESQKRIKENKQKKQNKQKQEQKLEKKQEKKFQKKEEKKQEMLNLPLGKEENIQNDKYPIVVSRYQNESPRPPHKQVQSPVHNQSEPHFILNTSEMNQIVHSGESSPHIRPKIFGSKSKGDNSRFTYTHNEQHHEAEEDLLVINHTKEKPGENYRHTFNDVYSYKSPKGNDQTKRFLSPQSHHYHDEKGMKNSSKKLSDYTEQKKKRRKIAPVSQLTPIEPYILKLYSQNFDFIENFCRFRRNCLEDNFTLYASSFLLVSCVIKRQSNSTIKVQILYANQSKSSLLVETLYRIPKCFKIDKVTKITKKFILEDYVHHIYTLNMAEFPLEACLLNLKYRHVNTPETYQNPTIISIPITIRNFVQCLLVNENQWKRYWARWSQGGYNFRIVKHVILDKSVLSDDEMGEGLHEFVNVGPVEGYSIDEYGSYCQHSSFPNLNFLLRISIRVDNILSIELLTDRRVNKVDDQKDFLQYCLDNWAMLLGKVDYEDID